MIQEIIVYLIGAAIAIFLLVKVYKAFFGKKENQGLGCGSGCGCSSNNYRSNRIRN